MIKRKILQAAVAATLMETGFDNADQMAVETLTEILQSYIVEIGNSSRGFCELAGRTEPIYADVLLALVNMGLKVSEIEAFAKREKKSTIPPPLQMTLQKTLNMLQAGVKQSHPSHIPAHLPQFPDPHTYIRTPTHKQPVTEYEAIREKAAEQKRDLVRALNKFVAKTGETDSLFTSQDTVFPLIACKPTVKPYVTALLPKDQIFEFEDEYSPHHVTSPARKSQIESNTGGSGAPSGSSAKQSKEPNENNSEEPNEQQLEEPERKDTPTDEPIDNPYLRPAKVPPPKIKIKDLMAQ